MNDFQNKPNFFGENSPFLSHPLLTPERTAKEVDFAVEVLNLKPGMRVLDVGCGFGRHSLALAERGYQVLGFDPSQAMIDAARERAGDRFPDLQLEYRCERGETFTAEQPFDAAIALFTTLGQVSGSEEKGENSGLVGNVFEALVPGGRFLVEVPQRGAVVTNLKTAEHFGNEENYTDIRRDYNSHSQLLMEQFEIKNGQELRRFLLKYKLYSRVEVEALLKEAGFRIAGVYGGYEGQALTEESLVVLVSAVK